MNILTDLLSWTLYDNVSVEDDHFVLDIWGSDASSVTGSIEWAQPTAAGDRFTGELVWEITTPPASDVWFILLNDEGGQLFSHQLYGEDMPTSGSVSIDVALPVGAIPYTTIGVAPDNVFQNPPGTDHIGTITLTSAVSISTAPWWYCAPKEPVVCPVRPTEFVPFSEYDADFKYPLASSRVAKPVPKTAAGECQPCSPTLIECSEESNPEPVCGWVPISESGYGYQFLNYGEASLASMVDSVVSYVGDDTTSWGIDIHFVAPLVRVTCLEWSAEADGGNASFAWGMGSQYNVAVDPTTSFAPSPLEMQLAIFEGDSSNFSFYSPVSEGNPRSYSFLVEVFMCPDQ